MEVSRIDEVLMCLPKLAKSLIWPEESVHEAELLLLR